MNIYNANVSVAETHEPVGKLSSDRRESDRIQSVLSGIILVNGEFAHQCVINEVSRGGMRLSLTTKDRLPSEFMVKTPSIIDGIEVELAWQRGCLAGVRFKSFSE